MGESVGQVMQGRALTGRSRPSQGFPQGFGREWNCCSGVCPCLLYLSDLPMNMEGLWGG